METRRGVVKALLSGNEAVARGAYESGVVFASAYPGTPSTEILENVAKYDEIYAEWSPNEKVALDAAIGAAYAGKRALAAMKHVGLNVAAEALFYSSYTGINGALVIVTGDDPGMHSSQNEQDNRYYAKFAKVPMLEPTDSQESKEFVGLGLEISERFDTPVLLRMTTRICHSMSVVELRERKAVGSEPLAYEHNPQKYAMLPAFARLRHPVIEQRLKDLAEYSESFPYNKIEWGDKSLGVLANGVSYQYAREVFPEASFLKMGMSWPMPEGLIREFASKVDRLIVVEELDPFIEEHLKMMGIEVAAGKEYFPIVGEFNPRIVREAAYKAGLVSELAEVRKVDVGELPPRPPVMCAGCPHRPVYYMLKKHGVVVNGDIGCYALAALAPLATIDTIGCMGASIGVAHGMNKAGFEGRAVATIGDSTFWHSGMPPLLNVIYNKSNTVTVIVDNQTTAMTGHQNHPSTGRTLKGEETARGDFEALARAMGYEEVRTVDPLDLKELEEALTASLESNKPAVLIARSPCVFLYEERPGLYEVDLERCNACGRCFEIGCPAIMRSDEIVAKTGKAKAEINTILCFGCAVCEQVCARKAIHTVEGQ
jgi:indolepyruvate ferredoxin oxidoreductase alpha subunit